MIPTREQELAVLQAVVYASLFDYPLTLDQLHQNLVGVRADARTIESWWHNSLLLQATVDYRNGWFFPAGRSELVFVRARRESLSRALIDRDRRIVSLIARMPFVRMVALSGSLAHLNADGAADLDLFVITAPHRVWSVTVATLVLARLLGCRKRVCMNYVVSESALRIAPEDMFSANQIIHLRPITGHGTFARFVDANPFVKAWYPNFDRPKPHAVAEAAAGRQAPGPWPLAERLLSLGAAPLAEHLARALYGWHLRRRSATWQSRDQVRLEDECLKLHTSSHRAATVARFNQAMTGAMTPFTKTARPLAS